MSSETLNNLIVYRRKSLYSIGFYASLLMVSVILIPDLNGIATEVLICITALWLPGILKNKIALSKQLWSVFLCLVIYLIIIITYKSLGVSTAWWDIAAGYYGSVCCALISLYSLKLLSEKQHKYLNWGIYGVFMLGMVYVYRKGINALATMNLEDAISQEAAAYGSAVMIFSGITFIAFLSSKSFLLKILYGIAIILSLGITIVIMQRGTNVIMSVLMLMMIFLFNYVKGVKIKKILTVFLIFGVILYITGIYTVLLEFLIESIPSERLATRVQAIYFFLQTGDALDAGSSMTSRSELMLRSIHTFTDSIGNFLFGVGDHRKLGGPVGNHAELLDTFARYGIILSIPLVVYFIKLIKWWYATLPQSSVLRYQVICIIAIYVARNIWGFAITSAISILLFLYLPLVVSSLLKSNKATI